ncbi:MAG: lysine-2,3-aminomutase-like protein [Candidatus Pacebacteria bacterium]|nr:lysine-2,3-aminomutase-like protein [Candidatus Paceibacterota bacterium]
MTIRSLNELIHSGLAAESDRQGLGPVVEQFAVTLSDEVTAILAKVPAEDLPHDPIARQYIPRAAELEPDPLAVDDPIGDARFTPIKGLTHRYPDRVLLKPLEVCAVYCRFCFRRETINQGESPLNETELQTIYDYLAARPKIWEVILSGGDPLLLSPRRMAKIVARLAAIPHIGVLRIHTRIPVVEPSLITDDLIAALKSRLPVFVLLHSNHPREFTEAAVAAIARLVDAGIPMLGQSVLLRGINDSAEVLTALFRRMIELRIKPHYLHHTDLTAGTAEFRTDIGDGIALLRSLRGKVSGLCHPHYMIEIPGGAGKIPLTYPWAKPLADGSGQWLIESPDGLVYDYPLQG